MVRAWHGRGMVRVNQTRPHCINQMGKTHSKPLAARHGRGMLCVNRPKDSQVMDYREIPYVRYSIQFVDISPDNSDTDVLVFRHDCSLLLRHTVRSVRTKK